MKEKWHLHVFNYYNFSISSQLWFAVRNSCVITIFYNPHLILSRRYDIEQRLETKGSNLLWLRTTYSVACISAPPPPITAPSLSCPLNFLTSVCVNTGDPPNAYYPLCLWSLCCLTEQGKGYNKCGAGGGQTCRRGGWQCCGPAPEGNVKVSWKRNNNLQNSLLKTIEQQGQDWQ